MHVLMQIESIFFVVISPEVHVAELTLASMVGKDSFWFDQRETLPVAEAESNEQGAQSWLSPYIYFPYET